jgi:hypothetical protein
MVRGGNYANASKQKSAVGARILSGSGVDGGVDMRILGCFRLIYFRGLKASTNAMLLIGRPAFGDARFAG